MTTRWSRVLERTGPLQPAELLTRQAYEGARPRVVSALLAHKRDRRIALRDGATLVFESRATAWFQAQEELRFHPQVSPRVVNEVLARANQMVPEPHELAATILIEDPGPSGEQLSRHLARDVHHLTLDVGVRRYRAALRSPDEAGEAIPFLRFRPIGGGTGKPALRWAPLNVYAPLSVLTTASLLADGLANEPPRRPMHITAA